MNTTVNKYVILSLSVVFFAGYALESSTNENKKVRVKEETSKKSVIQAVESAKLVKTVAPEIAVLNPGSINSEIQKLGLNELKNRKETISKVIGEKKFVERFNRHELSPAEVLELRRLALESSLITVRMFELN